MESQTSEMPGKASRLLTIGTQRKKFIAWIMGNLSLVNLIFEMKKDLP